MATFRRALVPATPPQIAGTSAFAAFPCRGEREHATCFELAGFLVCASCGLAAAQTTTVPQGADHPGSACPPGTGANAPTVGKEQDRPLSDQLAQSKGVICPPAGVDPRCVKRRPEGGALKVIPPPGSPGGNPSVQPK